ncbi:tripartite tricarboxylate transporter TctB family protein [Aquabacterium soli]|nr:tripartite tricarboxylate transporter TctB family protein [Aquabacterium soli]
MPSFIRSPKDFISGLLFLIIGLAAMALGSDYPMGKAIRMGPGYYPMVLSGLLAIVGLACMLKALATRGPSLEPVHLKPLLLVTVSVVLFGLLLRHAGMVAALAVSIYLSSLASSRFTFKAATITFVLLTLFCWGVFIKALSLPIPLVGPWFSALGLS